MRLELLKNEPALLIHEGTRRILIVADLHLGYERILFKKESLAPSLSQGISQHLNLLVSQVEPTEVIILGDLKHSIQDFSLMELREVVNLLQQIHKATPVTIIRGNHDANLDLVLPDGITLMPASGMALKFRSYKIYLLHGHAQPSEEMLNSHILIMAHIHPTIAIPSLKERVSTHHIWVRTSWNPSIFKTITRWFGKEKLATALKKQHIQEMKIIIMPAFLNILQGHVLNRDKLNARLGTPLFKHLNLNDAEIIMLDHTFLGKLHQLRFHQPNTSKEDF